MRAPESRISSSGSAPGSGVRTATVTHATARRGANGRVKSVSAGGLPKLSSARAVLTALIKSAFPIASKESQPSESKVLTMVFAGFSSPLRQRQIPPITVTVAFKALITAFSAALSFSAAIRSGFRALTPVSSKLSVSKAPRPEMILLPE